MKTLVYHINESSLTELKEFIKFNFDNDYDKVISILSKRFKKSYIKYCKEKQIQSDTWYLFDDYENRLTFINTLNPENSDNLGLFSIEDIINESNIFSLIYKKLNIQRDDELQKILTTLSKYSLSGKTGSGRFEYMLALFCNGTVTKANKGDIHLNDKNTNIQIEVKYCNNSNFGAYKQDVSLSLRILYNLLNQYAIKSELSENDILVKRRGRPKTKDTDINTDDKYELSIDDLIKILSNWFVFTKNDINTNIVEVFIENKKVNKNNVIRISLGELKQCIGYLQFYTYITTEFTDKHSKNYLMLFYEEKNISSSSYGNYIYLDINDFLNNKNLGQSVIDFCDKHIQWYIINRNVVEFTLK